MDEGILFFDSSDAKKNRISFQEFLSENFSYRDNEGIQKKITRISRQFSDCKGYTYKEKQMKFLNDLIEILMERKRKLENW
jgi:predicted lipase